MNFRNIIYAVPLGTLWILRCKICTLEDNIFICQQVLNGIDTQIIQIRLPFGGIFIYRVRPLIMIHLRKNIFIKNDYQTINKHLIVMINHKDYIINDFFFISIPFYIF